MSDTSCRLCGAQGDFRHHRVREMQFGTREEFDYLECAACGTLQIEQVPSPADLARHYPPAYYSFSPATGPFRSWLWLQRDKHNAGRRSFVGALVQRLRPDSTMRLLVDAGVSSQHRILDVGCGRGQLLDRFAELGFQHLSGIDPFLDGDLVTERGVQVRRQSMQDLDGEYDVIMFNHSLEHVPDPEVDLRLAYDHLAPGGLVLVRLPTTDSVGWQEHGVHWASLDAPRHLVLPSRRGMRETAARAGLEHVRTVDDSHWMQYHLTELFEKDISPADPAADTSVADEDRGRLEGLAERANREGRGDQALFVLRKPAS